MLNEIDTNLPPEVARKAQRSVGLPEVMFVAGGLLATAGIALVSIPLALLALGVLLMLVSWRSA